MRVPVKGYKQLARFPEEDFYGWDKRPGSFDVCPPSDPDQLIGLGYAGLQKLSFGDIVV